MIDINKINSDFSYFLNGTSQIEICEECEGKLIKLKTPIENDSSVDFGKLIFELQWMLHTYKERHPDLIIDKMLVGRLILSPLEIVKALNVKIGFFIKVNYRSEQSIKVPLSN